MQISLLQVGIAEVGFLKVGFLQVGFLQVGFLQVVVGEVGSYKAARVRSTSTSGFLSRQSFQAREPSRNILICSSLAITCPVLPTFTLPISHA